MSIADLDMRDHMAPRISLASQRQRDGTDDEPTAFVAPGVEIDRRQRLAAAFLLLAFDLPQPLERAAQSMRDAATVCPGLTMQDIFDMGDASHLAYLTEARDLIDTMIREARGAQPPLTEEPDV